MRRLKPKPPPVTWAFDPLANRQVAHTIIGVLGEHGQVVSDCLADIRGPTVTRYEFELVGNATISNIRKLEPELGAALLVGNQVRVSGAIPGRPGIGIEVPNPTRDLVTLGDLLARPAPDNHPMTVPLGLDLAGEVVWVNLAEGPHGIIGGASGSGKTTALVALVTALLMRSTPDQVRMFLIDPKRTELACFNGAPHLYKPVCYDVTEAISYLEWLKGEMARRYKILEQSRSREISEHNKVIGVERLPWLLFVCDEYADIADDGGSDILKLVLHLGRMGRAAGIHLFLATQRPTVDVIHGNIKSNSLFRWGFRMYSGTDSQTILARNGAERLCGNGDSLLDFPGRGDITRLQAPLVTDPEVERVVTWCSDQRAANYLETVVPGLGAHSARPPTDDELAVIAARLLTEEGVIGVPVTAKGLSYALIAEGHDVGPAKANKVLAVLWGQGVVSAVDGNRARKTLVTRAQAEAIMGVTHDG